MVSEGVKIRAEIDRDAVRNVMLVSGGGCIALLALLPSVMGTTLVVGMMGAFACWVLSLSLAVVHNVLRRHCSLVHDAHNYKPPVGKPKFGITPKQPWVCWWSWKLLYTSIAFFLIGGAIIVGYGFASIDELTENEISAQNECTED